MTASTGEVIMAYDSDEIFAEIDKRLSEAPASHLYDLALGLGCSQPTIEKAIRKATFLSFRAYRVKKLLEKVQQFQQNGYTKKQIGFELGYKWPGNLSRFIKGAKCCLDKIKESTSALIRCKNK
jgi:AraC-like DNA-binding protein